MKMLRGRWLLAVPVFVLLAACAPAASDRAARTIAVGMSDDLRFEPDEISVAAGETVRFEVTNEGQLVHEFLIGDEAAQAQYAEEMAGGGMHHETDAGVSVEPGETMSFEYTFSDSGDLLLAGCHEPGHFDGGMVATITVAD